MAGVRLVNMKATASSLG